MIFYFTGIATDEKGQELLDEKGCPITSAYAATGDRAVALKVLEVLRQSQTADRVTYAPGSIGTVNDKAYQAECDHRAKQEKAQEKKENALTGLDKLIDFLPKSDNEDE